MNVPAGVISRNCPSCKAHAIRAKCKACGKRVSVVCDCGSHWVMGGTWVPNVTPWIACGECGEDTKPKCEDCFANPFTGEPEKPRAPRTDPIVLGKRFKKVESLVDRIVEERTGTAWAEPGQGVTVSRIVKALASMTPSEETREQWSAAYSHLPARATKDSVTSLRRTNITLTGLPLVGADLDRIAQCRIER